ncbi:DUF6000 family protein [Streptomyces coelicoflavus]|uniref:DUF6000 family protein n=1 Tax=Streptomyces coelicoflavus TaxID=285562 RepID=UPI0036BE1AF3
MLTHAPRGLEPTAADPGRHPTSDIRPVRCPGRQELQPIIEVCRCGLAYCAALASFGTSRDADVLVTYLTRGHATVRPVSGRRCSRRAALRRDGLGGAASLRSRRLHADPAG